MDVRLGGRFERMRVTSWEEQSALVSRIRDHVMSSSTGDVAGEIHGAPSEHYTRTATGDRSMSLHR